MAGTSRPKNTSFRQIGTLLLLLLLQRPERRAAVPFLIIRVKNQILKTKTIKLIYLRRVLNHLTFADPDIVNSFLSWVAYIRVLH